MSSPRASGTKAQRPSGPKRYGRYFITTVSTTMIKGRPRKYSGTLKERMAKAAKKLHNKTLLDYYVVYYIPDEHYCGITNNPKKRMIVHKSKGMNVEGWRVLSCHDTLIEARHQENLFHSVLGMEGISLH